MDRPPFFVWRLIHEWMDAGRAVRGMPGRSGNPTTTTGYEDRLAATLGTLTREAVEVRRSE
jgi:hypothetical protein